MFCGYALLEEAEVPAGVSMSWGTVIFIGIMFVLLMIGVFVKVRR
jgi:hypothetical protein